MDTIDHQAFKQETPAANRRKMKKRAKLSDLDQLDIAHKVLIEKSYHTEVAREYRISASRISAIIKKV